MDENEKIRNYKDRLRIFLILYVFGEPYSDSNFPNLIRIFKSEQRIQKIDFLIRNSDYLSYELINIAKFDLSKQLEIKKIVIEIFKNKEPVLRRLEMERFFFGAYEDIDNVIAFLKSVDFIDFTSKKSIDLKTIEKKYFITKYAIDKFESTIQALPALNWYVERCELIKKYFGDLTGSQLRISQYQIDEYKNTSYREYIGGIQDNVITEFFNLYSVKL